MNMNVRKLLPIVAFAATAGVSAQTTLGSGLDKANMNLSVKPGTDFFEYAGGGWMQAHPLTAEYARYSQFDALQENNRKQLRELIEEMAAKKAGPGSLEQKIGGLYRLAMDSVRRNAEGFAPIKGHLAEVEAIASRRRLQYVTGRLSAKGIGSFFSIGCDADLKDSRVNLVQVNQGGIAMGERDYYLGDDEPTRKVRDAYRQYVKKLFIMTGKDEAAAEKAMEGVLSVETRIAKASYSSTKLRDVEGNYHKMTYAQLLNDYPGVDWSTLFLLNGMPAFEQVSVN